MGHMGYIGFPLLWNSLPNNIWTQAQYQFLGLVLKCICLVRHFVKHPFLCTSLVLVLCTLYSSRLSHSVRAVIARPAGALSCALSQCTQSITSFILLLTL